MKTTALRVYSTEPATHRGRLIENSNGYGIIECEECGFIHTDPVPAPEELEKVYREEYYRDEKPLYIKRLVEDQRWWEGVYDDRYDFFESKVRSVTRSMIDIGCGAGFFLKKGMERGWKCLGVEPSSQASDHAASLGVNVVNSFFDDETASHIKERFDAAHLSEVLEHVPDPAAVLKRVRGLLKLGGVVCCVVPNDFSPVQKVLSERLNYRPYWLAPPHHINYFNAHSLPALMERCGFEVIGKTSMFPIDFFLLMGENYVGNDELGRSCHAKRKKLDIMLSEPGLKNFKKEMYELMARHGIGREIVIFGRRK